MHFNLQMKINQFFHFLTHFHRNIIKYSHTHPLAVNHCIPFSEIGFENQDKNIFIPYRNQKPIKHCKKHNIKMIYKILCHLAPVIGIAGYLSYPKDLRIDATFLNCFSIVHNTLLVGFSAWTFLSLSKILCQRGIVFETQFYFQDPHFDTIAFYFYLSKYYEFIDTFLLYLNGKTPLFLQKFHHIGAAIN